MKNIADGKHCLHGRKSCAYAQSSTGLSEIVGRWIRPVRSMARGCAACISSSIKRILD
ncbi:MAG: hypothetical protein ACYC27_20745 [Armatimonadota bacterium]